MENSNFETEQFEPKFRVYDEKSGEIFVAEATAVQGDGRYVSLGCKEVLPREGGREIIPAYGPIEEEGLHFSWFTGWTDRNGDEVYEGDILKRVRHLAAEHEREWLEHEEDAPEVDDIDDFVTDYSGALGVVRWREGGFFIHHIEGHKWAFHGPEGTLDASWNEDLEVVGNKWEDPNLLSQ